MVTFWLKFRGMQIPVRSRETTLGRSAYSTLVLQSRLASRQHCVLRLENGMLTVTDLDSRHGTFVNGERVRGSRVLAAGDVMRAGWDVFEVFQEEHFEVRSQGRMVTSSEAFTSEDEPTTQSRVDLLEVLEAYIIEARRSGNPRFVSPAIRRSVESLVEPSARELTRGDRVRLAAIIENIAAVARGGELEEWREDVAARLDALRDS